MSRIFPLAGGGGGGAAPDASTTTKGIVELATDGETAANVAVQGNDARLAAVAGKLAQGAGDAIGENEVILGDNTATTLKGSNVYVTGGTSPIVALGGQTSAFPALKRNGTSIDVRLADDSGYASLRLGVFRVNDNGTDRVAVYGDGTRVIFELNDNTQIRFGNDAGLSRVAAGTHQLDGGTYGDRAGWLRWAGQSYLAADATNETTTMAATGLTVTVKSGRKYAFKLVLFLSDSVAADGAKIDFAGGTATETDFRAQVTAFDAALALSAQLDDLTDVASIATLTGNGVIEIHGSFEPGGNGTFAPRFAQAAHTAGTLTIYRGSHLLVWEMP